MAISFEVQITSAGYRTGWIILFKRGENLLYLRWRRLKQMPLLFATDRLRQAANESILNGG